MLMVFGSQMLCEMLVGRCEEQLDWAETVLEAGQAAVSVWLLFGKFRPGIWLHFIQHLNQSLQLLRYTLHRNLEKVGHSVFALLKCNIHNISYICCLPPPAGRSAEGRLHQRHQESTGGQSKSPDRGGSSEQLHTAPPSHLGENCLQNSPGKKKHKDLIITIAHSRIFPSSCVSMARTICLSMVMDSCILWRTADTDPVDIDSFSGT